MAQDVQQQAKKIIEESRRVLVLCNKNLDGDSIGSAFAVFFLLKKMEKNAALVLNGGLPEKYQFLPKAEFSTDFPPKKTGPVLAINLNQKDIREVYYEKNGVDLKIFITPGDCVLSEKDISISKNPIYDLIMTISSPDPADLGPIFEGNRGLVKDIPILNVDWRPDNGNYGKINLVLTSAGSSGEILTDLVKSHFENLLDSDIATCLLAAIIDNTKNLQLRSSRQTFFLASYLMEKGADQQKIIRHLYKEKSLGELKLLGRILARLEEDAKKEITYALLPYDDFVLTNTGVPQLARALQEFKETASAFNPFLLLWENEKKEIWGVLLCREISKIQGLEKKLGGIIKDEKLFFRPNATMLKEAGREILGLI